MIIKLQVDKIRNAIDLLANKLNCEFIRQFSLSKILLFGSCARDALTPTSDVDICIVYISLTESEKYEIHKFIENFFDGICKMDLVWCTENTFSNGVYVFDSIRKEGLVLYDKLL